MKYLEFNKTHHIEDINGGLVVDMNSDIVTVDFGTFFKAIVMSDDRWGKNIKTLTMLMDIRDQAKQLSANYYNQNKFLELTDEAWEICLEIVENPMQGYNVAVASALFEHIKDLKKATSIKPEVKAE